MGIASWEGRSEIKEFYRCYMSLKFVGVHSTNFLRSNQQHLIAVNSGVGIVPILQVKRDIHAVGVLWTMTPRPSLTGREGLSVEIGI